MKISTRRAMAAALYTVVLVAVVGCSKGKPPTEYLPPPPPSTTNTLTVTTTTGGTITSTPAAINCGTTCYASYPVGANVTLTAALTTGFQFGGWSGACTGTAITCSVTMNKAQSVGATFTAITPPTTFTLTVTTMGTGTVTSMPAGINCGTACTGSYAENSMVTLTATAATGSQFSGWSGACTGTTTTCAVTMSQARTVGAAFTATLPPTSFGLTVNTTGSGSVTSAPAGINCGATCTASYSSGTAVTLTAAPANGSQFTGWTGACSGSANTCMVTLSQARTVGATFTANTPTSFILSTSSTGGGSITSAPAGINCGTACSSSYASGTSVTLTASPASGQQFNGWSGSCTGTSVTCTVTMTQALSVVAAFSSTGQFGARPYLFKADEARLRASIAANDPEATGSANNNAGSPIGFLTLIRAANADRSNYDDISTWQMAFGGWLLNDTAILQRARDEAMAIVSASPGGDTGTGDNFQHIEERLLDVAATTDLAYSQFSSTQLAQVATWVNGTLSNWNSKNISFWPFDEPRNNYWQNGFLAHVIGGIATEGFNSQAAAWRTKSVEMAGKFTLATTGNNWSGPVQSEGHYYAGYVSHALWAMQLYDAAMGTSLVTTSQFSVTNQLDLVMYETRPFLLKFFEVGSEANNSLATHTGVSIAYWYHLIHSAPTTPQAQQAKAILAVALNDSDNFWGRSDKGFINFYWNVRGVTTVPLTAKTDRLLVTPTPGAGLIGLRSSAGFQTTARAAIMFANMFNSDPAFSHSNADAPGFQWGSGADWLVTDPEFYSNSGILAEAGSGVYSDVSNIVTLAGQQSSDNGTYPIITHAEDNSGAAVPHYYVQINAQPYWTASSVYRRDYVWLDDLQVVAIFDHVVGTPAKTWRLHIPAAPTINGTTVSYVINAKTVTVRDLFSSAAAAWTSTNLNGSLTQSNVWRLAQTDASNDYRSLKVLDVGGRVTAATLTTGTGFYQANLTISGVTRTVRFNDDGSHAVVQ